MTQQTWRALQDLDTRAARGDVQEGEVIRFFEEVREEWIARVKEHGEDEINTL